MGSSTPAPVIARRVAESLAAAAVGGAIGAALIVGLRALQEPEEFPEFEFFISDPDTNEQQDTDYCLFLARSLENLMPNDPESS